MKCLDEVRVELRGYWFFLIFVSKVLLSKLLYGHSFILQDLTDGSRYFRMYFWEELIVVLLLLIIFLDLSEAHSNLHMFILILHLILNHTRSILIFIIKFYPGHSIEKFLFPFYNFFEIGLLSPSILDQIMLLYFIDMKKIELVDLIKQKFHWNISNSKIKRRVLFIMEKLDVIDNFVKSVVCITVWVCFR